MDAAQRNGLMVFFNLDGATLDAVKEAKIKKMVQCVKNHPALYVWYLADEPYKDKISPSTLSLIPIFFINWNIIRVWGKIIPINVFMPQLWLVIAMTAVI